MGGLAPWEASDADGKVAVGPDSGVGKHESFSIGFPALQLDVFV